ncbi:MAG: hypothetical protein ACM3X5_04550 [Bacillota bacterium]
MRLAILTLAGLAAGAAILGGCASDERRVALEQPTEPVLVTADNSAMPYTTESYFFRDRGLHYEDPSTLSPKAYIAVPRG